MQILSHRGYWNSHIPKNSLASFRHSLQHHFGFESDIRDYQGRLVISHNIADRSSPEAERVFQLLLEEKDEYCFAINIKADGLKDSLKLLLEKYPIKNYFAFDMSLPQMIAYRDDGIRFFTRQSEVEVLPYLYDDAAGIWIDAFDDDLWITEDLLQAHLEKGKVLCIVSPELHQRDELLFWQRLRSFPISTEKVLLCTDKPAEAAAYFGNETGGKR